MAKHVFLDALTQKGVVEDDVPYAFALMCQGAGALEDAMEAQADDCIDDDDDGETDDSHKLLDVMSFEQLHGGHPEEPERLLNLWAKEAETTLFGRLYPLLRLRGRVLASLQEEWGILEHDLPECWDRVLTAARGMSTKKLREVLEAHGGKRILKEIEETTPPPPPQEPQKSPRGGEGSPHGGPMSPRAHIPHMPHVDLHLNLPFGGHHEEEEVWGPRQGLELALALVASCEAEEKALFLLRARPRLMQRILLEGNVMKHEADECFAQIQFAGGTLGLNNLKERVRLATEGPSDEEKQQRQGAAGGGEEETGDGETDPTKLIKALRRAARLMEERCPLLLAGSDEDDEESSDEEEDVVYHHEITVDQDGNETICQTQEHTVDFDAWREESHRLGADFGARASVMRRISVTGGAEVDEFGNEKVNQTWGQESSAGSAAEGGTGDPKKDAELERKKQWEENEKANDPLVAEYPVFGLYRVPFHRRPRVREMIEDGLPLISISLYQLWFPVTTKMLELIQCDPFPSAGEDSCVGCGAKGVSAYRYMYAPDHVCYANAHGTISMIAIAGIAAWSIGILVWIFGTIYKRSGELQSAAVQRAFGYFINGFEPDYFMWEGLKRADIALTATIAYTNIVPEPKARIILFGILAGTMLALHSGAMPFDDRQNGLLDRIENHGLYVRFLVFGIVQVVILFAAPMSVSWGLAGLACLLMVSFISRILCHIFVEVVLGKGAEANNKKDKGGGKKAAAKAPGGKGGGSGPKAIIQAIVRKLLGKVIAKAQVYAEKVLMMVAKKVAKAKELAEDEMLWLRWRGPNRGVELCRRDGTPADEPYKVHTGCMKRFNTRMAQAFFKLGDDAQKDFFCNNLSNFTGHVICTSDIADVPSDFLDVCMLVTICVKILNEELEKEEEGEGSDDDDDDKGKQGKGAEEQHKPGGSTEQEAKGGPQLTRATGKVGEGEGGKGPALERQSTLSLKEEKLQKIMGSFWISHEPGYQEKEICMEDINTMVMYCYRLTGVQTEHLMLYCAVHLRKMREKQDQEQAEAEAREAAAEAAAEAAWKGEEAAADGEEQPEPAAEGTEAAATTEGGSRRGSKKRGSAATAGADSLEVMDEGKGKDVEDAGGAPFGGLGYMNGGGGGSRDHHHHDVEALRERIAELESKLLQANEDASAVDTKLVRFLEGVEVGGDIGNGNGGLTRKQRAGAGAGGSQEFTGVLPALPPGGGSSTKGTTGLSSWMPWAATPAQNGSGGKPRTSADSEAKRERELRQRVKQLESRLLDAEEAAAHSWEQSWQVPAPSARVASRGLPSRPAEVGSFRI